MLEKPVKEAEREYADKKYIWDPVEDHEFNENSVEYNYRTEYWQKQIGIKRC